MLLSHIDFYSTFINPHDPFTYQSFHQDLRNDLRTNPPLFLIVVEFNNLCACAIYCMLTFILSAKNTCTFLHKRQLWTFILQITTFRCEQCSTIDFFSFSFRRDSIPFCYMISRAQGMTLSVVIDNSLRTGKIIFYILTFKCFH